MEFAGSLVAAYCVVWAGICLYLFRLLRQARQVEGDVAALRSRR